MAMSAVGRYDDITPKYQIRPGSPNVYRLIPNREDIGKIARWTFGTKNVRKLNKTILLVGETGSGKTTLINALVNYALGVEWEDNIWFEIVEETKAQRGTESLTADVSVYELFGFEGRTMPFSLTLIDTPGFGDTRGNKYDDSISLRLLQLFSSDGGVYELNAVGLVLKSTENRLHDRQKYIFNSVLSLFGKNMENKIVTLVTHSDGRTPKNVLKALEDANIKCAKDEWNQPVYFLFNNCQKENREEDTLILKQAYRRTRQGMGQFRNFLESTNPQSLVTTTRVIQLKASFENLKERIKFNEEKQRAAKENKNSLEKIKEEKVELEEVYKDKEPYEDERSATSSLFKKLGTLSCNVCEENCHDPCKVAWTKGQCKVITDDKCTVCTGKCSVSVHVKRKWRYVIKTRKVLMTLGEIAEKYNGNKEEKQLRELLEILEKEGKKLQKEKKKLLEEAFEHVLTLNEIALKFTSVVTHDSLDFLIDRMKESGFEEKACKLEEIKTGQEEN